LRQNVAAERFGKEVIDHLEWKRNFLGGVSRADEDMPHLMRGPKSLDELLH
jgi:hypothetical protein